MLTGLYLPALPRLAKRFAYPCRPYGAAKVCQQAIRDDDGFDGWRKAANLPQIAVLRRF
jgi:hypothetical protein